MPRFSVIITAYNVEAYISQCVDSIRQQTFKDFEIIIVDDKSTDNTGNILNKYKESDSDIRIETLHENSGASIARNRGVSKAQGDYILFVDGDDYLTQNALEEIEKSIIDYDHPDWIYGNGNYEFSDYDASRIELKNYEKSFDRMSGSSGLAMLETFVDHKGGIWSLWGKAYKRDFWLSLDCISERRYSEDIEMGFRILEKAERVAIVPALYCYRRAREGSLITQFNSDNLFLFIEVLKEWIDYLSKDSICTGIKEKILRRINDEFCCALLPKIYYADCPERERLLKEIATIEVYLDYPFNLRNKCIGYLYKIFGRRFACQFLNISKRIVRLKHKI